jgi:UDP-glucose 4-epimerase
MNKILLTGGLGYIGSHVCIELLNEGYELILLDNLSNSSIGVLHNIKKISGIMPIYYQNDIRDIDLLTKIFKKHSIDSVIHFAGLKSVNESVNKSIEYYDNNLKGTLTLLKVMGEANCKSIVFSSSATVYGDSLEVPITEGAPLFAKNPYGRTKLYVEEILRDLCISENDWKVSILRYFNPAGAHESGLIGESPIGTPNNLFPYIGDVAIGNYDKLTIFGDDYNTHDGTGVRDYIHVVDLARGHIKALEFLRKNSGILIANLGTGVGYSVLDVVKNFELVSNIKIPYEISKRREGDIAMCYADPSLASEKLNWKAQYGLEEMCRDAWNWQKLKSLKKLS